jgi:hypothetical protein
LTRYATLIDEQTETAGEFPAHNPNRSLLRATGTDYVPVIAIGLIAGFCTCNGGSRVSNR